MQTRRSLPPLLFLLSAFCLCLANLSGAMAAPAAPSADEAAAAARIVADVRALTAFPSRVPGTPGNLKAADYVQRRFAEVGLKNVRVETDDATAPVTTGGRATLSMNGAALTVYPMYPNGVVPASTAPSGLTGTLIYAGKGTPRDYNGKKVEGAIVALDFDSGMNWIIAADLGARAVVFLESPQNTVRAEAERKFSAMPVEIPRFYAPAASAAAIRAASTRGAASATLKSEVLWDRVPVKNILGEVRGTDPELSKQTIIIGGYYDSMAVTPDLAPGAEAAGNMASLLEVARSFAARPSKYTLLFLAEGGHHLALAGMRNFAGRHFIDSTGKGGDAQKAEIAKYRAFVGLDLTSRTDTVGMFAKSSFYDQMTTGAENILLKQFFNFSKTVYEDYAVPEARRRGIQTEEFFVDGIRGLKGRTWRSYLPSLVALDSEVATMAQKAGISFATANDVRMLQDTPADTMAAMQPENLARQVGTVTMILGRALGSGTTPKNNDFASLPDASSLSANFGYAVGRAIYRDVTQGTSFLPNTPLPDETLLKKELPANTAKMTPEQRIIEAERLKSLVGMRAVAIVLARDREYKSYSGVRGAFIERARFSNATPDSPPSAQFVFLGARVGDQKGGGTPANEIESYSVDSSGRVVYAPDQGAERQRFSPMFTTATPSLTIGNEKTGEYSVNGTNICFKSRAVALFDTLDQRYFTILREVVVLDGQTDASPVQYGFLRPQSPPSQGDAEPIAIIFGESSKRFKVIMQQGLLGKRLIALQTEEGKAVHPEGFGIKVPAADSEAGERVTHVSYFVGRDMWTLDQQRIHLLKNFGINNERVDILHGQAGCPVNPAKAGSYDCPKDFASVPTGGSLVAASTSLKNLQYDEFYSQARRAFGLESRAYPDVEATAQDVLKGIVFYLALLMPFSFFLERLLFGWPDIRKQVAYAFVMFLFVFFVISRVHPAFALAQTPFIILLAFIILALTFVVTMFLSSKFEAEIKKLKQGVHFADVGRLSALSAALGLGIANMRRRPTRTALTCVTLVLLTFTVLSFTSVSASISNFARPYGEEGTTPGYAGLMIRQPDWSPMQEASVASMRNEFRQRFGRIALRAWYLSRDQGEPLYVRVANAQDPSRYFLAPALLGLTPEEKSIGSPLPQTVLPGGRWFQDGDQNVCLLPRSILLPGKGSGQNASTREPLGLTPQTALGATVDVVGQPMKVIGIFDDTKWSNAAGSRGLRDLDDEQFTPVDYQNDQNKQTTQSVGLSGQKGEEAQVQRYQHMDANALVVIPYETALAMGGTTRSLAAGFNNMPAVVPAAAAVTPPRAASTDPRVLASESQRLAQAAPDADATNGVAPSSNQATPATTAASTTGVAPNGRVLTANERGEAELQDLMNRAALGIFGATPGENGQLVTKLYSSVESTSYEGFAALLVPIIIAALIIANTMLGSVYERTREIGIYSSVGLAPIHVAALFIAEAIVYAVLGSISGYLVAQVVAKVITANGWLEGITLNYSSSSAVIATLIVMATVLLSTLYPAFQASRMSQPDIERRWQMSVPDGDVWRFKFPFTVSGQQPLGVAQFLADFFETHTDTSIGSFYTDKIHFNALTLSRAVEILNERPINPDGDDASTRAVPVKAKVEAVEGAPLIEDTNAAIDIEKIAAAAHTEVYHLGMRVWLAPFDMGVSQEVDILLMPSEERGLYELQLKLVRQSGEIAAWKRVNRGFMSDLRKQLLLWRTIKPAGQQEYILRGRAHVSGAPIPVETPGATVAATA